MTSEKNLPAIPSELSCAACLKDGSRLFPVGEYRLSVDTEKSRYFRSGKKQMLHLAFRSDDGFSVEAHLEKSDGYPILSEEYTSVSVTDAAGAPVRTVRFKPIDSALWGQFSADVQAQFLGWYEKYRLPYPDIAVDIEITSDVRGICLNCTVTDDRY